MLDDATINVGILDGSPMFAQIVEDARLATGVGVVVLTTWSKSDCVIQTQASSGYATSLADAALRAIRLIFPSFKPERVTTHAQVNPIHEVVYLEGQAVTAPFKLAAAGVVPEAILRLASKFLSLEYSTLQPLLVQGRVAGALSFHGAEMPTDAALVAYEAFARQVALTLENAILLRTLQKQLEELRETRRLVSATNEAVRREIAERLHGPVQTKLVVADFTLRKATALIDAEPLAAKQAIADARRLVDTVRENDIRDVSHILHPCAVDLGLAAAVRSLADRFSAMMDVRVDVHPDLDGIGAIAAVHTDESVRLTAYRIIEEALGNAHKHGMARAVDISLTVIGSDRMRCTVSDDGIGFTGTGTPGLGLRMIAMKVDEVDGTWSIGRGESGGTVLSVDLPLSVPEGRVVAGQLAAAFR